MKQKLSKIKQAITDYHIALDKRQNGVLAQSSAIHQIEDILDMPWVHGQALRETLTNKDAREKSN